MVAFFFEQYYFKMCLTSILLRNNVAWLGTPRRGPRSGGKGAGTAGAAHGPAPARR